MRKFSIIITLFCILINSSSLAQSKCRMLFFDEFNDNSWNWPTKESKKRCSQNISNGYYYLEGFMKRRAWKVTKDFDYTIEINESKNFEIEASIKKISTVEKRSASGLIFGSNRQDYFCFVINDNGKFKYVKRKGGKFEVIIPWTESEYINQGMGSTNKLTIKKEGDKIKLYSNDNFLSETPFQSFFGNSTGFYIGRKQKIGIDYFRYIYMPKDKQ